jgi:hypothetical protein
VKIMNANWTAGSDGEDGGFELMIVTSDDRRHVVAPSQAAMTALVALAQADTVLGWDPAGRTLIGANPRGTMAWTEDAEKAGYVGQLFRRPRNVRGSSRKCSTTDRPGQNAKGRRGKPAPEQGFCRAL